MDSIKIFDVRVDKLNFKDAVDNIEAYLKSDRLNTIFTPNPEIVMRARDNEEVKNIINNGDMVTADGIGIIYASRIKKNPLEERVTGFDMSMEILDIGNREGYSIYLLGGKPGVAEKASQNLKSKYKNLKIAGFHHGYFKGSHNGNVDHEDELKIIEEINKTNPDIIFVGLGYPNQELWIGRNQDRIKSRLIIGNGGVIDILAGVAERAPEKWQKLGLEWLYRLIKNPSRIKRQLILPKFMLEVIFRKNVIEDYNKKHT